MSGRVNKTKGRKRRPGGFVQVLGGVALVAALLYWDQAALVYVLSTLALCGLLLVVAFSDLDRGDFKAGVSSEDEKGAEAGAGVATADTPAHTRGVAAKRKRRAAA